MEGERNEVLEYVRGVPTTNWPTALQTIETRLKSHLENLMMNTRQVATGFLCLLPAFSVRSAPQVYGPTLRRRPISLG